MNVEKKRKIALIIAFFLGLNGVVNMAVGAASFLTVNSLNITDKASTLRVMINSVDLNFIEYYPELMSQMSSLKMKVVESLDLIIVYSGYLGIVPAYFLTQGATFLALASALYYVVRELPPHK